jgi:serine/threonine protein kinase
VGGSREEWLARYPECASALAQFFDDRERVDQLLLPVRENVPGATQAAIPAIGRKDSAAQETVDVVLAPPHFLGERYRTVRFHAHGGMGEIWLARDERIGRQVAVKRLRPGRDGEQARFQIEAQVTGQLEHPGVVPLHDLGLDASGQPYFVMKFVQGRSLRESIADYHAHKSAAGWPRDLEFLRLLESFVSVCNAVAYAHSNGVLHRDIKPDNVMLGPFGETRLTGA